MNEQHPAQNPSAPPTIIVTGDLTADWLHWSVPAPEDKTPRPNWQLVSGTRTAVVPGGAWLLAEMVRKATGYDIEAQRVPDDLEINPPQQYLRSHVRLDLFPPKIDRDRKAQKSTVLRIKENLGYEGPKDGTLPPVALAPKIRQAPADLVIIDDAGNGFRDYTDVNPDKEGNASYPNAWLNALDDENTWVILKRSRPLYHEDSLCEKLLEHPERLLMIINADDLRSEGKEGVNISRRLSWERTAKDLYWQVAANPRLECLKELHHLVVRFGLDGAIYFFRDNKGNLKEARLFYDPLRVEGDFAEEACQGTMTGLSNAFVAALVEPLWRHRFQVNQDEQDVKAKKQKWGLQGLDEGIKAGLRASRRLLLRGFGNQQNSPTPFGQDIFTSQSKKETADDNFVIAEIAVAPQYFQDEPDPYGWTILQDLLAETAKEQGREEGKAEEQDQAGLDSAETAKEKDQAGLGPADKSEEKERDRLDLAAMTQRIVKVGVEPGQKEDDQAAKVISSIPAARFGGLVTLDRAEMESLRCIKNIMIEYLKKPQKEPLSIAVFGPPGAGKSFAVTEVANSIQVGGVKIEPLEFNLSQWDSPRDLINALHRVRDEVLGGAVPLVFFDEFDAAFQGEPLGWLKYFLDPMQSGKFKEGESIHPLGKTIFVFAGGTSRTLQEFSRQDLHRATGVPSFPKLHIPLKPDDDPQKVLQVLLIGCNPGEAAQADPKGLEKFKMAKGPDFVSRLKGYVNILGVNRTGPADRFYRIRRAVILHNILKGMAKKRFPELLKGNEVQIHDSVITSLLMTPEYKHGVRSLGAILNMSALSGSRVIEQAALPPEAQLELHVDAAIFRRLPALMGIGKKHHDGLAQAIHEKFRKNQNGKKDDNDDAMQPWETLIELYRDSNRGQADQIMEKLLAVGCFVVKADQAMPDFTFTETEVEFLAEMEHDRWMIEKIDHGYMYGREKNDEEKRHNCLLAWELLDEPTKDKDRNAVRAIPEMLAAIGYGIQRVRR